MNENPDLSILSDNVDKSQNNKKQFVRYSDCMDEQQQQQLAVEAVKAAAATAAAISK